MKQWFIGAVDTNRWLVRAFFQFGGIAMVFPTTDAAAAEVNEPARPDKSGFTFIDPTPREQLRKLSPDRPDNTDIPYTVDVGLQFGVVENIKLDCGRNFGLTRAVDDFNAFAGITVSY